MKQIRRIVSATLVCALVSLQLAVPGAAQRRTTRRPAPAKPVARRPASVGNPSAADARLTGTYQLDEPNSDDPQEAATRAANGLPYDVQQRVVDSLIPRLTSPTQLTLQRRARLIDIASTRAPRITFDADGITRSERAADGHLVQTRAALTGDSLAISSRGNAEDEFAVTFESIEQSGRLRVTRRIYDAQLTQPVVVVSVYDKTSGLARFDIYGQPEATSTSARNTERNPPRPPGRNAPPAATANNRPPQTTPPVMRPRPPAPVPPTNVPPDTGFTIGRNTQLVAVLDDDLSTARTRVGDPFTMTVREPAQFAGATIAGTIARVERGGRINGRAELAFNFERIRLTDGRTDEFNGVVEAVQPVGGEEVRVDAEGSGDVQASNTQGNRTVERAAIGAAVGAIIGAIARGGKGAVIGAAVGAGAGAGSVYVQGRDDLELPRGSQVTLRANPNG